MTRRKKAEKNATRRIPVPLEPTSGHLYRYHLIATIRYLVATSYTCASLGGLCVPDTAQARSFDTRNLISDREIPDPEGDYGEGTSRSGVWVRTFEGNGGGFRKASEGISLSFSFGVSSNEFQRILPRLTPVPRRG